MKGLQDIQVEVLEHSFGVSRSYFQAAMATLLGMKVNRGEHLIVCTRSEWGAEAVVGVVQEKVQDLFG